MRDGRLIAATLAVGAFMVPAAHADRVTVVKPTHYVQRPWLKLTAQVRSILLGAAYRTTPETACKGRVHWVFNAGAGRGLFLYDVQVGGYADRLTCEIHVEPTTTFYRACIVLAHELRHFTGIDHVEDPNSLMYGGSLYKVRTRECDRAYRIYQRNAYQHGT